MRLESKLFYQLRDVIVDILFGLEFNKMDVLYNGLVRFSKNFIEVKNSSEFSN